MRRLNEAVAARLAIRITGNMALAHQVFKQKVDLIRDEHYRLSTGPKGLSPYSSAEGYLKTECYLLLLKYQTRWGHELIKRLTYFGIRDPRQPLYESNPFYWGLLAIDPDFRELKAKDLSLLSKQLLHARRHRIAPQHLIGFLYQCGSQAALRQKVAANLREEAFEDVSRRYDALVNGIDW